MMSIASFTEASWKVGVIGLGYVGLPFAVNATEHGLTCVGYDVDTSKVASLSKGLSPVTDVSDVILERALHNGLSITADPADLSGCMALFLCVPSPLDRHREPDLTFIELAAMTAARQARPGALVCLESTTYPGTTEEIVLKALIAEGFTLDEDIYVAYSPERVDPGHGISIASIPKVVGGVSSESGRVAAAAYQRMFDHVHQVSFARVAEMTKLLENTYRAVNIALANEMAILAHALDIDIWEVIEAAATKPFGFEAFYPGPGVGGHCIPLDPHYLGWKAKEAGVASRFIGVADAINLNMPDYVVTRIIEILNDLKLPVRGSKILAVGLTYKPNVADDRESPAIGVLERLQKRGAELTVLDPFVPFEEVSRRKWAWMTPRELDPTSFDLVVVLTDHDGLDYVKLARQSRAVFDTRGVFRRRKIKGAAITSI